jgi:hypothetical protein
MQFKQLLMIALLILCIAPAVSQHLTQSNSKQYKEFTSLLAQANASFTFPRGFKEIKAVSNEDFDFDYAIGLPGREFEIWFQVKSQKQNFQSYQHSEKQLANPDSLYLDMAKAQATAFTGGQDYVVRNLPAEVLARYNADAGKSYMLNLLDLPETKHFKYALLIMLQKNHIGTIMAVCFTNVKDAEFFKRMRTAADCVKFKADKS